MSHLKQNSILIVIIFMFSFDAHAENMNDSTRLVTLDSVAGAKVTKSSAPVVGNRNDDNYSSKNADADQEAKAKAKAKLKAKAKAKAKLKAESDKEAQIILFLKNGQSCGSWFDASGSTGDAGAYDQIKSSGYTKANAPEAIKKQIALGVASCDKKYLVEKPVYVADTKVATEIEKPQEIEGKDQQLHEVNGVMGFFSRLIESIKNSGTSKHDCTPGERAIHSTGC